MTQLHRLSISLNGKKKELSAHTIASFLVAQGVPGVPDLAINRPMNRQALLFMNDTTAIHHWISTGRLEESGNTFFLTPTGVAECVERESGEARDAAGRRKKECVTPELIREMREVILHGRYHDKAVTFETAQFDLGWDQ